MDDNLENFITQLHKTFFMDAGYREETLSLQNPQNKLDDNLATTFISKPPIKQHLNTPLISGYRAPTYTEGAFGPQ